MAYESESLLKEILEIISRENLYFIYEISALHSVRESTLYDKFGKDSNEMETIKEALSKNRIKSRKKIQKKWEDSDNPTANIFLYKLIAPKQERERLYNSSAKEEEKKSQDIKVQLTDNITGTL